MERGKKKITNMLTGTIKLLTALPSAVAAASLLVDGIGSMNIVHVAFRFPAMAGAEWIGFLWRLESETGGGLRRNTQMTRR